GQSRRRRPVHRASGPRRPRADDRRKPPVTALLEVTDATKAFGGTLAVDSCSFAVQHGTVTALIGPNGSGKTTLFNLITGYLRPDGGQVRFNGRETTGLAAGTLYRRRPSPPFPPAHAL